MIPHFDFDQPELYDGPPDINEVTFHDIVQENLHGQKKFSICILEKNYLFTLKNIIII